MVGFLTPIVWLGHGSADFNRTCFATYTQRMLGTVYQIPATTVQAVLQSPVPVRRARRCYIITDQFSGFVGTVTAEIINCRRYVWGVEARGYNGTFEALPLVSIAVDD